MASTEIDSCDGVEWTLIGCALVAAMKSNRNLLSVVD